MKEMIALFLGRITHAVGQDICWHGCRSELGGEER